MIFARTGASSSARLKRSGRVVELKKGGQNMVWW